jgi:hypothetical protein
MQDKFILKNAMTADEVSFLENYFYTRDEHIHTNGMKKYPVLGTSHESEFLKILDDIIKNKVGIDKEYELLGDNFYEHYGSYFPHTDSVQPNSWLNILVPIKLFGQKEIQKFIVFDQQYIQGNRTWMGTKKMTGDYVSNKKIEKRIFDSDGVINLTNIDIPDELYSDIWKFHFPKDELFGLSGQSFDWIPGDIIVFNSRCIHTTGKMNCQKKLGLSIRIGYVE